MPLVFGWQPEFFGERDYFKGCAVATMYRSALMKEKKKLKDLFVTTSLFTDIAFENGILSTSDYGGFVCWDWKKKEILCRIPRRKNRIRLPFVNVTEKRRVILPTSKNFNVGIYDYSGELIHSQKLHEHGIETLGFSDNKIITMGTYFTMLDGDTLDIITQFRTHKGYETNSLEINHDLVAYTAKGRSIYLYDIRENMASKKYLDGHTGYVSSIKMRNDVLVSCSSDCTVKVWDLRMNQTLHQYTTGESMKDLQIDRNTIVAGTKSGKLYFWDLRLPEDVILGRVKTRGTLRCIATHNNSYFVGGTYLKHVTPKIKTKLLNVF